ncbi:MAG: hypothetical protein L6R38_008566 [Xanthoria sp. 2 TBL-2021]|nr:MAG: hypothetical protein L6R38_008566 [Xanthoria sp. 2 TBL-2021]
MNRTRILPIITAHDPQLKALLHSIEKNFLDLRLHKLDVERFLRIGSIEQLIRVCSANANGLDGILGVPSGFNLDNQGLMDVGSAVPSTGAPASTSDDEDAVYNIQELLGSGRDSAAELGGVGIRQRRHSPTGQRRLSPTGPAALPTPPTTLEKIGTKRGVGPQSEESPTKRR